MFKIDRKCGGYLRRVGVKEWLPKTASREECQISKVR